MRGLRFLSLLTFIATIGSIIYILNGKDDFYSIFEDIERGSAQTLTFTQKIKSYFAYADSWNYLILAAFIAILIFLFVFNDFFLGKFFQNQKRGKNGNGSFLTGGFVWLTRMFLSIVLVFVEFVLLSNIIILIYSSGKLLNNPGDIASRKTVLLLGTNKRTKSGNDNLYYYARIQAVVDLYKSGKVRKIVISGDNSRADYNEPGDMRRDLIKKGIPSSIIVLDYAGFRTLDSVVRLKNEYRVRDVIIVSQKFHVERALFLSWFYNIEAKAYVARGNMTNEMLKRELLAKPKVLMDLFLFNMQPKYGKTQVRAGIDLKRDKDLVLLITVGTLFLISGLLLKNTFIY